MQSFFIGTGSVIAALLPWVFTNWFGLSNTAPAGVIPDSVKWSFYLGAFAFLSAVMYTVFTTKEFPPEDLEAFRRKKKQQTFTDALIEPFTGIMKMPRTMRQLAWVQFFTWFALFAMWIYSTNAVTANIYDMKVNRAVFDKMDSYLKSNLETFSGSSQSKELQQLRALETDASEIRQFQQGKSEVIISINLANYFSIQDMMGKTEKAELERTIAEYNSGANWLGVCSSIRNGMAALFAFIIPMIAARTSRRRTHMICLLIGGIGLVSIKFITDPMYIAFSMGLVGIAWASILSMPYAILAGSLPSDRMGYFMGVFNFFIVIPQIVAASILGYLTLHLFGGNTLSTIVLGGVSMIFAGILTLFVKDDD